MTENHTEHITNRNTDWWSACGQLSTEMRILNVLSHQHGTDLTYNHILFSFLFCFSVTRAVPDHVYSEQNLRPKEIKHQVWALMFHWFSPVHRSPISLRLFTQLVSYKLFLPVANFSPPSQELGEGTWRLLEHAGIGEGEVGSPGKAG